MTEKLGVNEKEPAFGQKTQTTTVFVGALAYADDVTLLAPTPIAMRHLLYICEQYGRKFSIVFNANKSAWLYVTKGKQHYAGTTEFSIGHRTYFG